MSTQPTPKSKAYKELLTTSLHKRFTNASAVVLAFCLVEAYFLSKDNFLWAWNPFGYTGLTTFLLFIPCLFIFIVRVYNLHFGARTTTSGFQTFYHSLVSGQALITFGWYFAASQLFGEVYIWTQGRDGNLGWVDQGRAYERARLNENPLALRCLYGVMAAVQTGIHLYNDLDYVQLGEKSTPKKEVETLQKLTAHALPIAREALALTVAGIVSTILSYYTLLRQLFWSPTYSIAKVFDSQLPRYAPPTGLIHVTTLSWQAFISALSLALLWGVSNAVFTAFMAEAPLKKAQPLTNDMTTTNGTLVSKAVDANGSLINGLTRKKETPHTFALWELYIICTQFPERRKNMFLEIDRAGGNTWTQISQACLSEIQAISSRIQQHQNSAAPQVAAPSQPVAQPAGLPRIATEQPRQEDILRKPRADLAQAVSSLARSAGQHPGAVNPISPAAKSAERALGRLLTPDAQQQLTKANIDKQANGKLLQVLQTPLGEPLRETFARTASAVVLGTPYSAQQNIAHAAKSLAALLKASSDEDKYGLVAKDVPLIIRTLLGSIQSTRQFLETLKPSWTDVEFDPSQRQVPEVLEVLRELQQALEAILLTFGEYATSLGMSKKELREAKEAVGIKAVQEMVHVR